MRKVRFGIIGTNFITDWILEAAREELRFEATAVCSRSRETGQAFALKHGIPHLFTSPEEMAASSLIDAVYIAVPNSLHAALSILFMQQGKHVLCEKPLASNAKEAREMIRVARQNGVTLMEAMKSTLTPNFRQLRRHLAEAGCLSRYFASYCQYSSRYDKLKAGIVLNAFNPELSNGAMMDLGVYTVYPLVVLFGRPKRHRIETFDRSRRPRGCKLRIRKPECYRSVFKDCRFLFTCRNPGRKRNFYFRSYSNHP